MNTDWTYDGCDEEDVARIEEYWRQSRMQIESKAAGLSDSPTELRMHVEQNDEEPEWTISASLHLPGRTISAESEARTAEEAMNDLLYGLAEQIDRLQDAAEQVTIRREGLDGLATLLDDWHAEGASAAFMSFLTPVVESLGSYVQRELIIEENDNGLGGEEIVAADVLNEVLVEAWRQYDKRDRELRLDLWLVQLADEALQRLGRPVADSSLDDETPEPTGENAGSEADEWIEQAGYPETIDVSELLAGEPGIEAWEQLELETRQAHLATMLADLPWERRQAFVLNVAHGFEVAHIADFQDRSPADVEEDIAAATAAVRRSILDEQTPDDEEPFAREQLRDRKRRHARPYH